MKFFLATIMSLVGVFSLLNSSIAQRPNIVFIVLDDADKRLLPPNAPSFVEEPNLSRIYQEGAQFNNMYCVLPYCNPSRYSFITGFYPHSHGATDNLNPPTNTSLPNFPTILQSAGYHNIVIGKYTNVDVNPAGFENRFCCKEVDYFTPTFYRNGVKDKIIGGYTTSVINDTMVNWIANVDTPFFAWVGHIAPHGAVGLLDQDKGYYHNDNIQLPPNAKYWTANYPSYTYDPLGSCNTDSATIRNDIELEYEVMLEVDRGLGRLFDTLQKRGVLDNTMIVLCNDNGAAYGEHFLMGKQKPYEPVSNLPLYIRYPKWFDTTASACYDNLMASVDFAPTFISVAGLKTKPYHFQGISLQQTIFRNKGRNAVYFETIKTGDELWPQNIGVTECPSWRAVRNVHYKYVRYHCDSLVEELFDMENDSLEMTNLVRDPSHHADLFYMRHLLDSMAHVTKDTISVDTIYGPCTLVSAGSGQRLEAYVPFEVTTSPNPATDLINVGVISSDIQHRSLFNMFLYNQLGIPVKSWIYLPDDGFTMNINVAALSRGLYFLKVDHGNDSRIIPILLQ